MLKKLSAHQKRTSKRLSAHINSFIAEIPSNLAVVSADGRYKYWSRAFHQNVMPNLTEGEISEIHLLANDYNTLKPDGNAFDKEERPLVKAMKTGRKVSNVIVGIPAGQGLWTWVELTVTPIKNTKDGAFDYICLFEMMSGAHTVKTDLTVQTLQDRLTGLPNRSLFTELATRAIYRIGKHSSRVGVLFLDLNRFKLINDTLGHNAGDKLLIQVSWRLKSAVKQGDTVARMGGDEFAILFEYLNDLSEAVFVSDWIKNAFEEPFMLDDEECYITGSIGLAVTDRASATAEELIRDAEVAMYRAKSRGLDTLEIYDQSMNEQTRDRIKMESDMRRALKENEFFLYYQPLINLPTGKIAGWEALIRWKHPERGLVSPIDFIGLAEETGLIIPLGTWVIDEACRQAQEWQIKYPAYSESIMNVNLSMRQFQQQLLQERIVKILKDRGFEPRLLKLEITESVTMKDPMTSLAIMNALSALKIHLAIDDFGTDYSSLSYLKRMPVDTLKIDKSFIDGITLDDESKAIVQAIISLAKALDISVTAEGIESADQFLLLKGMGCDIGQGYYFSRPLSPADAEKLMEQDTIWQ